MQIVIDIPDYIYDHAKEYSEDSRDERITMNAVKNGIPLPKGHGRIYDLDKLIKHYSEFEMVDKRITGGYIIPPIIEADKE